MEHPAREMGDGKKLIEFPHRQILGRAPGCENEDEDVAVTCRSRLWTARSLRLRTDPDPRTPFQQPLAKRRLRRRERGVPGPKREQGGERRT